MKALSFMPSQSSIDKLLEPFYENEYFFLPEEREAKLEPIDTRHFIRYLREQRKYNFSRDFIY